MLQQETESRRQRQDDEGHERRAPVQLGELAMRGMGQMYDMNLSAMRVWMQTQARAASAFGWPDWSGLFTNGDGPARHLFGTSAEQWVQTAQRASEAAAELQREVGRVVETQSAVVAETIQHGLEEIGAKAGEGLDQLVQTVREQADEAERVSSSNGERLREALQGNGAAPEDDGEGTDGEQEGGEQPQRRATAPSGKGRRGPQKGRGRRASA